MELVQYLTENGADLHAMSKEELKPVNVASKWGNTDVFFHLDKIMNLHKPKKTRIFHLSIV